MTFSGEGHVVLIDCSCPLKPPVLLFHSHCFPHEAWVFSWCCTAIYYILMHWWTHQTQGSSFIRESWIMSKAKHSGQKSSFTHIYYPTQWICMSSSWLHHQLFIHFVPVWTLLYVLFWVLVNFFPLVPGPDGCPFCHSDFTRLRKRAVTGARTNSISFHLLIFPFPSNW